MAVETREESARPGVIARLLAFKDELRQELKQVIWPNRTTVWETGLVVLFCCVFFGAFLYAADGLLGYTLSSTLERALARVFGA